jgi:hypothetical protein
MSHESSNHIEPRRLIDDPTIGAELRRDLRAYAAMPVAFDAGAGLLSLQSALLDPQAGAHLGGVEEASTWLQTPASASTQALGATKGSGFLGALSSKVVAAGLSVSVAGGVGYYGLSDSNSKTPASVAGVLEPSEAKIAPPLAPLSPTVDPALEANTPVNDERNEIAAEANLAAPNEAGDAVEKHSLNRSKRHENASTTRRADPREEARLVARARESLNHDPQTTLVLLDDARQKFGAGALAQERAGLRVLALFSLGRTATATNEAKTYLAKYPQGPLAHRIAEKLK